MGRPCLSCASPKRDEIDRKLRAGTSNADVARWLASIGTTLTPQAVGQHAKAHLDLLPVRGRRPVSTDFLTDVVESARVSLAEGGATVRDGIRAQSEINKQAARSADRDLAARLALMLMGYGPARALPDPELDVLEAEFTPLLAAGGDN